MKWAFMYAQRYIGSTSQWGVLTMIIEAPDKETALIHFGRASHLAEHMEFRLLAVVEVPE